MLSKANVRSHPIHPMLIPFPIAFLAGAIGFDIAGVILDNPDLWRTGGLYTVPPNSSGKRRATYHSRATR